MPTEKIQIINSQSLMEMELTPTRFIVERLIPQGIHILAGAPKIGKSWLLLHLCLKVANGERFWNYRTQRGTVLYLCLEDSPNRIQQRMSELTEDAPPNLYFATSVHSLTDDLSEQIEDFLQEYPDTNLIVIDTLQKVRAVTNDANSYAADYKDISALKEIADKHGIAIIAVQHLRKQFDSDPHLMVTGSTGLLGAADGSYVLRKENISDDTAKLYIRGRDIEEQVLTVRFDSETREWTFISSDSSEIDVMKNDAVISLLTEYMRREKEFRGTASQLAECLGGAVKGNVLTRKLNRYKNELSEIGIEFEKSRSGERREVVLKYCQTNNNGDMTIKSECGTISS